MFEKCPSERLYKSENWKITEYEMYKVLFIVNEIVRPRYRQTALEYVFDISFCTSTFSAIESITVI